MVGPRLAAAALLAIATATPASARCPGARYDVQGTAPSLGGQTISTLSMFPAARAVGLASGCIPTRQKVKAPKRGGGRVTARFTCDGVGGPVRLRAKIARDCTSLVGVLKTKGARGTRLTALRGSAPGERLGDEPGAPLLSVLRDLDASPPHPDSEIGLADGRPLVRTILEVAFTPNATVGDVDAVLDLLGGGVVGMLAGVPIVIVGLPDPASVEALDTLVAAVQSSPAVRFVNRAFVDAATVLPDGIALPADGSAGDLALVDHDLAIRAHAAWNALGALQSVHRPVMVVADLFGGGPPDDAVDARLTPADFQLLPAADAHGYHVLGIVAGSFGGPNETSARGKATGILPRRPDVRVIDLKGRLTHPETQTRIIQMVRGLSEHAVVNTSLGYICNGLGGTCIPDAEARQNAVTWIEKVRGAGLEDRFLHVTSAGNVDIPGVDDAATKYFASSAALLPDLGVDNLTNTLVIENGINTTQPPFTIQCLNAFSFVGGQLSAIGTDVFSITGASVGAGNLTGTSMASPQVAGLAGLLWSMAPDLTPQEVAGALRASARTDAVPSAAPACSLSPPAPTVDAYGAVLSLDPPAALQSTGPLFAPVRSALLDVDTDGDFDGDDLFEFLVILLDPRTNQPRQPLLPDFSRYDLNGDGFTATIQTAPFDLDRVGSTRAGASQLGIVTIPLGDDVGAAFDERELTDFEILCYYAYTPLFASTGNAFRSTELTPERCNGVLVEGFIVPSTITPGTDGLLDAHVAFVKINGEEHDLPGVRVELNPSGGTVDSFAGTTDETGHFQTRARLFAGSAKLEVEIVVRARDGGAVLARTTVEASAGLTTTTLPAQVEDFSANVFARATARLPSGPPFDVDTAEVSASAPETSLAGGPSASAALNEPGCDVSATSQATIDTAVTLGPGNSFAGLTYTGSVSGTSHRDFVTNCESRASANSSVRVTFVVPGGSTRPYTLTATMAGSGVLSGEVRASLVRISAPTAFLEHLAIPVTSPRNGVLTAGHYTMSVVLGDRHEVIANPPGPDTVSSNGNATVTFTLD